MVETHQYFKNRYGLKLDGILHKPKNFKSVGFVIAHGFTSCKDRELFPKLASKLEDKGYLSFRFDFSGNCESEGNFSDRTYAKYVEDLKAAIDYVSGFVSKVCVIGHSMGGAVGVLTANRSSSIDYLVLLAPAIKADGFKRMASKINDKGYYEFVDVHGKNRKIKKEFFDDVSSYNLVKEASALSLPVLFVLAGKDEMVDNKSNLKVSKRLGSKVVMLAKENHIFHNKVSDKMFRGILGLVK